MDSSSGKNYCNVTCTGYHYFNPGSISGGRQIGGGCQSAVPTTPVVQLVGTNYAYVYLNGFAPCSTSDAATKGCSSSKPNLY